MVQRDTYYSTYARLKRYGTPEREARHLAYLASLSGRRKDQQLSAKHTAAA
jgi:hypothetical protein